ncbi:MAG: transcriptional repressor [Hyphomicrobium sp.]|nr:transcriptional repressor [Hyphomicrobium sp.]
MRRAQAAPAFPTPGHDHAPCLKETLQRAADAFEARGLKLTPLRQRVLEEVAGSHHAIGAYEILERLSQKERARMAPISVYRALDALLEMGVVHRLESRNAYFACHAPHGKHGTRQIILACERCATVAEVDTPAAFDEIDAAARGAGFGPTRVMVEVTGLCATCAAAPA